MSRSRSKTCGRGFRSLDYLDCVGLITFCHNILYERDVRTQWSSYLSSSSSVSSIYRPTLFWGLFNKLEAADVGTCQGRGINDLRAWVSFFGLSRLCNNFLPQHFIWTWRTQRSSYLSSSSSDWNICIEVLRAARRQRPAKSTVIL